MRVCRYTRLALSAVLGRHCYAPQWRPPISMLVVAAAVVPEAVALKRRARLSAGAWAGAAGGDAGPAAASAAAAAAESYRNLV